MIKHPFTNEHPKTKSYITKRHGQKDREIKTPVIKRYTEIKRLPTFFLTIKKSNKSNKEQESHLTTEGSKNVQSGFWSLEFGQNYVN